MDNDRHNAPLGNRNATGAYGTRPGTSAGTRGPFGAGGYDPSLTIGELETMRPQEDAGAMLLAGRYRAVRRLGEGGMGSVWLAEDLKLDGRPVAVKMLPAVLAGKKGAFRQVKQEALMAMKLSHPNIATVRAFEEDEGGIPFLVMDYIEGEAMDDLLAEKGALPEAEALKLLEPVAAALDYAHSQGVVHRDVKPANVVVRKDGTPFVLDFGIAREIQETMTRVTGKLSSGTLMYMSPEQLHGHAPKVAQDVYSFAAMAYECLGGRPPFATGQIEYRIDHDAPAPLPRELAGRALLDGIMSGLSKDPESRPESCTAVLGGERKETGKTASHSAVRASRPAAGSATTRFKPLAKENRKVLASACAALVLAVAVVCWLAGRGRGGGLDEEVANQLALGAKTKAENVVSMDRGQGFGEKLDEMATKRAQGEAALHEKHFGKATECFEAAIAAAEWCIRNAPLREEAVKAQAMADTARTNAVAVGGDSLGVTAWRQAEKHRQTAESAFGKAHFREAGVAWNAAATAYGDAEKKARRVQVEQQLEAARGAKARGAWAEVVSAVVRVLELAPENAEAKALNAEAVAAMGVEENLDAARQAMARNAWIMVIAAADRVLELDPGNAEAMSFKEMATAEEERAEQLAQALDEAREAKSSGAWDKVIAAADRVLERDPENAEAKALKEEAEKKVAGTKVIELPGGANMTLVWCPAGSFVMGSPVAELGREENERQHRVMLTKGFWLAKTEVTQWQWKSVMGTNPSEFKGDDLPVENVSWNDAREFCKRAGLQLPTEAQWEYACRAGSTGPYSGTGKLDDMGWYGVPPEDWSNGQAHTHPVGCKRPNAWGLHDMHGNVWEWCDDCYGPYPATAVTNPTGAVTEGSRIYRGGAWHGQDLSGQSTNRSCRSANRSYNSPAYKANYLGFRPCLEEPAGKGR